MDAHVNKGSELGHVGNNTFEQHPLLKVSDLLNAVHKIGREELIAWVASGFAEFFQDVGESVDANGDAAPVDFVEQSRLFDELLNRRPEALGDLLDHRIGFGVNGGDVEGVIAVADSQEAGGLLEGLGADAG